MLQSFDHLSAAFARHLVSVDSWILLASFALSFAGAVFTFYLRSDHGLRKLPRDCLRYCFPWHVLRLPSCRIDGLFVVVHGITHALVLGPLLAGNVAAAVLVHRALILTFGPVPISPHAALLHPIIIIFAIVLTDFGYYCAHWLLHRFPLLWELHKVHHSVEYLIPISRRRLHPLEEIFDSSVVMLMVGTWLGSTAYAFGLPIERVGIAGVDAYFLLNAVSFYHLRHSHIPMSYGWLERLVISPAQHQLHHSTAPEHLGRNLGSALACWDWMFGTWAQSVAYDGLKLGLMPADRPQDYRSVFRLYWVPVCRLAERVAGSIRRLVATRDAAGTNVSEA